MILWALFGNDDDGIYGERSGVAGFHGVAPSAWQAVRWWLRNPFHNLLWKVLRWPGGPLVSYNMNGRGFQFYVGFRRNPQPERNGVFGIAVRYNRDDTR